MPKLVRWIALIIGILIAIPVIGLAAVYGLSSMRMGQTYEIPAQGLNVAIPTDAASLERGEHVAVAISKCMGCHGETLSGGKLSGAPGLPIPPNLTPDDETGLGKWTFAQFVTVMRTGTRPDGRVLNDFMPWDTYSAMSDDELTALWAALRAQPARKFGGR